MQPRAQETQYFQSAAGTLFHHPQGYVRMAWNSGRLSLDLIQAFYEQVLALMVQQRCQKILSDHGQRAPLPLTAQEWLTQSWIPRAIQEAGAHHCAIVEGADPIHRLSTQTVVTNAPSGLKFKRFSTRAEAETWLAGV